MKKKKLMEKRNNLLRNLNKTNKSFIKGVKNACNDENKKQVCVVGFISSGMFHDDKVKNPLSEDWDNGIKNSAEYFPQELIDDMRKNGWTDADGNVCFREDYQPLPVKGKDGNVYLAMNDSTMSTPAGMGYMMEGTRLLNE